MKELNLTKIKKVHFIGIGGIGLSAIARMMLEEGKSVSGSDQSASIITDELKKLGAEISIGHDSKNVPANCDMVVYTAALSEDNPELLEAKKRNTLTLTYFEALGWISRDKYTIAISGTHGKTTTTAMIGKIMIDAGLEPTVVIGSLIKNGNCRSNFIHGNSKYFLVEADEYKKSFHSLNPRILVITNIDEDHLDFYKDLADIQNSFAELAKKVPQDGFLIVNKLNPNLSPVLKEAKCNIIDYSSITVPKLKVPGEHNRMNARAALAVARALNVNGDKAKKSLEDFEGAWRRFEYKGRLKNGAMIYDDYAHNPEKIKSALNGARECFGKKRIIAVFQPHLYSRTKHFLSRLAGSFNEADSILIAPIYAAREKPDSSINSDILKDEVLKSGKMTISFRDFAGIENYLKDNTQDGDIIMTMGAGDIYKVGENLLKK